MKWLMLTVVVVVGVLHIRSGTASRPKFWCAFEDNICSSQGTCGYTDGDCTCNPGYSGLNCQADTSTTCADATYCDAVGTMACYVNGAGDDTCACQDGYTGPTCIDIVATLDCSSGSFVFTVLSNTDFDGNSIAFTKKGVAGCVTVSDPTFTVALDGADCDITETEDTDANTKTYKVTLYLQYNPNYLAVQDIYIDGECVFDTQTGVVSAVSPTVMFAKNAMQSLVVGPGSTSEDVTVTTKYSATTADALTDTIPAEADMGHLFQIIMSIPSTGSAYGRIAVESCSVDDGFSVGDTPIIGAKCALKGGSGILNDIERVSATEIKVTINTIIIAAAGASGKNRISCKVNMCLKTDTSNWCVDTTPSNCATPNFVGLTNNGAGRKKRATSNTTSEAEVTAEIRVRSLFDRAATSLPAVSSEACTMSQDLIIVISVLCFFILLLAVASVYFALRYIGQRRDKASDLQSVYSTARA